MWWNIVMGWIMCGLKTEYGLNCVGWKKLWAEICGLKKNNGLNCVGWKKIIGWNMWAEKIYELNCAGWIIYMGWIGVGLKSLWAATENWIMGQPTTAQNWSTAHELCGLSQAKSYFVTFFSLPCQLSRGKATDFVTINCCHKLVTLNIRTSYNHFVTVAFWRFDFRHLDVINLNFWRKSHILRRNRMSKSHRFLAVRIGPI